MKGIYPRDPKKKPNKATTYYHVKDISYIANEPIIDYFRQTKAFLKKVDWFLIRYKCFRLHGRMEEENIQKLFVNGKINQKCH